MRIPSHSPTIPVVLLVACCALARAADPKPERFTLTDGRSLIGTYDESSGVLTLVGPIKGAVTVKKEDIARREAVAVEALEAPKPKAKVAAKEATPAEKAQVDKTEQVQKARAALAKDKFDGDLLAKKIERNRQKIRDFRAQFAKRADSEHVYYNPEPREEKFYDEQQVNLPSAADANASVRGMVVETKGLVEKQAALTTRMDENRKLVAKLESELAAMGAPAAPVVAATPPPATAAPGAPPAPAGPAAPAVDPLPVDAVEPLK
jgi:hypothetical protein